MILKNKNKIILVGGGGHCKSVIDVVEKEGRFKIYGIIDLKDKIGQKVLDYEVIGSDEDLENIRNKVSYAIVTVGHVYDNTVRKNLYYKLRELKFILPNIISPLAYVSKYAKLGDGNVIMHKSMVNAGAIIGNNCIINSMALIEHDAVIEDHCHIATGAIVNGGVIVKENTFFGSNATSKQYIEISGFIKAGSVCK